MAAVLAFYNGTPIQMLIDVETVMEHARDMIKLGLKNGVDIKTQIQDYKTQLDSMEQDLASAFEIGKLVTLRDVTRHWGDQFKQHITIWYLDVAALLILKVIKDDDKNGFLVVPEEIADRIGVHKKLMNSCVVCAKQGSWKKCSTCKKDYYCGEECQKADWKRHKTTHK
jgi:hypothetical protein